MSPMSRDRMKAPSAHAAAIFQLSLKKSFTGPLPPHPLLAGFHPLQRSWRDCVSIRSRPVYVSPDGLFPASVPFLQLTVG